MTKQRSRAMARMPKARPLEGPCGQSTCVKLSGDIGRARKVVGWACN